ncbi:MAG: RagB/SusD family nutrient uptake outer membrane protein [Paludibacter sp.]
MKKLFIFIIYLSFSSLLLTSCLGDYLNVSPESGLDEEQVFSKQENFKKFFDIVYSDYGTYAISTGFGLHWAYSSQKFSLESLTDMSDAGRLQLSQPYKRGTMYPSQILYSFNEPTWSAPNGEQFGWFNAMWKAIRVANIALEKVDMIQNATEEEKNDLRAQAYFVRGFCHFQLSRSWGPMPHITKPLGPDDQWDIPQLSKYETYMAVVADMDAAIECYKKANTMRRDPGPGGALHLIDPNMFRPSGMAAAALRARALLYAASPLNNDKGTDAWAAAAIANWGAIQTALDLKYDLLPWANFKQNFNGNKYSNEQLWGWYAGTNTASSGHVQYLLPGVFNNSQYNSGECPTQNTVDKFETIWGDPLTTQAERDEAAALGHYNEQDPYANRDPRLDFTVIRNQSILPGTWSGGKAQIWIQTVGGTTTYGEILNPGFTGVTQTGYLSRKRWGGESTKNNVSVMYTDPVIRLAELYLNYAEAANEAYGPNTPAPGATMTAVDAINVIRTRAGMPNVLLKFTVNKEVFRARIKNERTIELAFEGHYYYDIRRWMDAPQAYSTTLYGVVVEKVAVSNNYPTGFKYTRAPLVANRQVAWQEGMYYLPFADKDYKLMKNYVFGPKW